MELENINLSEVSQAEKTTNRMFSLICGLRINVAMWLNLDHKKREEHILVI
jgi:hypothetical protein